MTTPRSLLADVAVVLARMRAEYEHGPEPVAGDASDALRGIERRIHEPLRVAIAGKVKAGKSTLLNALVGEVVAPTGAAECTKVVTWYRDGRTYRATAEPVDGPPVELVLRRDGNDVEVDLAGLDPASLSRIVVEWPAATLRTTTLIDTPGVGAIGPAAGDRTTAFLAPDDAAASPTDAVCYLTRHVHRSDVRFLEAFHDDAGGRASPVNAIAVLSRADEIGGGRTDSLASAARIAARVRTDATFRRLCQTVVPVAGLLAQGAVTLTEAEFQAFRRLAAAPDLDVEALLLSVDRFTRDDARGSGLVPAERVHLLERFGLFGVRVARELLRYEQVASARDMSDELRRRSGIDELRALLATRFVARRDVLRARSALLACHDVLRRWPPPADVSEALRRALEQVEAGAYEFAELRVLLAVRAGEVDLDDAAVVELERVLGSAGSPAERLAVGSDDPDELRAAVVDGVARWRGYAEHPLASPAIVEASQVVTRALERMLI